MNSLSWDSKNKVLYIGGLFNRLAGNPISPGLAIYNEASGLQPFPTTGLMQGSLEEGEALVVVFEPQSASLFVTGSFTTIGGVQCLNIAVWNRF